MGRQLMDLDVWLTAPGLTLDGPAEEAASLLLLSAMDNAEMGLSDLQSNVTMETKMTEMAAQLSAYSSSDGAAPIPIALLATQQLAYLSVVTEETLQGRSVMTEVWTILAVAIASAQLRSQDGTVEEEMLILLELAQSNVGMVF